jgi:hypothetical protein
MLWVCYLRKGIVYLPTCARVEGGGPSKDVEPVAVAAVSDAEALRRSLRETISRGNPVVPDVLRENVPAPVVLKYAGVKTWSAFARDTSVWHIAEKDGNYEIVGMRDGRFGGWEQDPDQRIKFAQGTSVDMVIERMIAVLQSAASR